jgi:hypothetical protein
MSYTCIFDKLYEGLCADEDGGGGGVPPTPSEFHADVFQRERRVTLRELPLSSIDRKIQITYEGVKEYAAFANADGTRRRLWLEAIVRVGYFAGDNVDDTHRIMMSDDLLLQRWLRDPDNYPSCQGVCVEDIIPVNSSVSALQQGRFILSIQLRMQVY